MPAGNPGDFGGGEGRRAEGPVRVRRDPEGEAALDPSEEDGREPRGRARSAVPAGRLADPEEPGRGRIYGCPAGWACGTLNENLLRALKLDRDYAMFAPGSGAAQKAAIVSAYKRKRDIVFYYWTPTSLVGALDLVKLDVRPADHLVDFFFFKQKTAYEIQV